MPQLNSSPSSAGGDAGRRRSPVGLLVAILGAGLLVVAWTFPASLKSVSPALLNAAGVETPSVGGFGRDLVENEKPGPAALVLIAAKGVGDPRAPALASALDAANARRPELVAWGGWDPFLDPIFDLKDSRGPAKTTPIISAFLPEKARGALRAYLANSRKEIVIALLNTREVKSTGRFVPATLPGGEPLDAVIVLAALLVQGDHLDPALQRELRALAETAVKNNALGEDLEAFYIDLLSLGQRLDWVQLAEFLRHTTDTHTVGEFAHLARVAPDQIPVIYTAALFSGSADRVASYLIQYGKAGIEDVQFAMGAGQGALRELLQRQLPIGRMRVPDLGIGAELGLSHPVVAILLKWAAFFAGAFLLLRGFDWFLLTRVSGSAGLPHMQGGILALILAGLLILATEPYLLQAAPPSEFKMRLLLPVLVTATAAPAAAPSSTPASMDSTTLLSIGFFAALQVVMYLVCLMKIREISNSTLPPFVRLKLMENEENLFDGGLYIGIGGTATALVLQVLKVIEPNLLAAYSSNLFGITCVALVKIRHVRPFRRELIIQSQDSLRPTTS